MAIKILRVTFVQPVNLGSQGKGSIAHEDVESITRQPDGVIIVPKGDKPNKSHTFIPNANISALAFEPEAKK